MNLKTALKLTQRALITLVILSCTGNKNNAQFESAIDRLNLKKGEITLCGSGTDQFGTISFSQSCDEKVRSDFNLAIALLHSFEYTEAEKIFAKVIEEDPECIMAYWGAAMSNFHPLWVTPNPSELQKGSKI